MGNSVSQTPVILYRLRLDPSIHWWKKIGVPRK